MQKKHIIMFFLYIISSINVRADTKSEQLCWGGKLNASELIQACTDAIKKETYGKEVKAIFYVQRGNAYAIQENWVDAINDYTAAIIFDPKLWVANLNRGDARIKIGDYVKALSDYDEVLKLDPHNSHAIDNIKRTREIIELNSKNTLRIR